MRRYRYVYVCTQHSRRGLCVCWCNASWRPGGVAHTVTLDTCRHSQLQNIHTYYTCRVSPDMGWCDLASYHLGSGSPTFGCCVSLYAFCRWASIDIFSFHCLVVRSLPLPQVHGLSLLQENEGLLLFQVMLASTSEFARSSILFDLIQVSGPLVSFTVH